MTVPLADVQAMDHDGSVLSPHEEATEVADAEAQGLPLAEGQTAYLCSAKYEGRDRVHCLRPCS